jgi:hypothetical protein
MATPAPKQCKDCEPGSKRPAPHPGPRCATHHRASRKAQKARTAARRVEKVYGLTQEQFELLWESQSFSCAICERPIRIRRPQVDHCHDTGIVRGLLCKPCNYGLLGQYDVVKLIRAARYLMEPPALAIIGEVVVPSDAKQVEGWMETE